jgi:hypothetical protein
MLDCLDDAFTDRLEAGDGRDIFALGLGTGFRFALLALDPLRAN